MYTCVNAWYRLTQVVPDRICRAVKWLCVCVRTAKNVKDVRVILYGIFSHTRTCTQPFYGSLDFDPHNPGEPVPQETFTHSYLSWSSFIPYVLPPIYYNPWHPPCSIYVPDSLFPRFLQVFMVYLFGYLLAWHPPLHTPYISSPNHCLVLL